MESKVISARIPVDVANEIEKMCTDNGISKSEYISNKVGVDRQNALEERVNAQPELPPQELYNLLSGAGATVVGIGSFNFVKQAMSTAVDEKGKPRYTEQQAQIASWMTAISIGLISFGVFDQFSE